MICVPGYLYVVLARFKVYLSIATPLKTITTIRRYIWQLVALPGIFLERHQDDQINPSTGKQLSSNQTRYNLADRVPSTAIEASYVYPHGGYYYLFASFDTCCTGTSSTYHIVVGRSSSVTGPYTDKGSMSMMQGGGTILLSTHGNVYGPGGQTIMHDTDGDLLVYHYFDGSGNKALGLSLLGWDSQGWPYVK